MTFSKKFSRPCPNWELKKTHRRTASLRNWACHVRSLSSPYHLPAALNFRESKLPKQYERGRCLNDERAALRILSPIVGAGSKREQSGAWCENFHTKHAIIAALARGVYHDRLDTHTHSTRFEGAFSLFKSAPAALFGLMPRRSAFFDFCSLEISHRRAHVQRKLKLNARLLLREENTQVHVFVGGIIIIFVF